MSFPTIEQRMITQPSTHRLFRPEEIVNPSTAAEHIPSRVRCYLDELSMVHHNPDRFVRPTAGVVENRSFISVESSVPQRSNAGGVHTANCVKHLFAHPLSSRTRSLRHAFEHPLSSRTIRHEKKVRCAIRIEPLTPFR